MQRSKIITILIIILIVVYIFLSQTYINKLGDVYTYIINPGFWIILMVLLRIFIIPGYNTKRFKKDIIQYVFITVLLYIIIYLLSGLLVGFGRNPYATNLYGFILNIFITGSIIVSKEYVRYQLINNVYHKDKKLILILVTIVFTLVEFDIFNFISQDLNGYIIFKQVFYKIIPLLLKNGLLSYISYKSDYTACIYYDLLLRVFLWVSPILPKSPWVMEAVLDCVFPVILILYIRYIVNKKSRIKIESRRINNYNPVTLIPLGMLLVLVIWFTLGLFPIKPVAVASRKYET